MVLENLKEPDQPVVLMRLTVVCKFSLWLDPADTQVEDETLEFDPTFLHDVKTVLVFFSLRMIILVVT